jgi:hypothetical protein
MIHDSCTVRVGSMYPTESIYGEHDEHHEPSDIRFIVHVDRFR